MKYEFARKRYYVEMFNYVWSMTEFDFEQLLLDGASGGIHDDWESYYNAKLLSGMKRGWQSERRNIFTLLDAKREDFEYALHDFNSGFFS